MKLFYIKLPTGTTFAIISKTSEDALQKALKYGTDGVIISSYILNKDWN